ncbi:MULTISPECIES: SLATT domain-containing protein [Salinivibrio]|uniref:SLATT domain-containing protein n=2 Tax=Salinivibrio TaxID=51366 RepID=A0ABX6K2I1_SALCS|nr:MULTISPECIES: SLATT domain-containing protein [Salinivibrio]OOF14568.1 hypothetical protein BZG83_05460 [Salinivibrio sp. PR919]QIR05659.1 SLATT domain-containing protein [Salinivibrio costicola]
MNKDNVWWTRKCWIKAEERLLKHARYSDFFMFWYSLWGVASSIIFIGEKQPEIISKVFVCFSVFVFGFSLFSSLGRFRERANNFKAGYIELQRIYMILNSKKKSKSERMDDENFKNYTKVLDSCENHTSLDFLRAKVDVYQNSVEKSSLTIIPCGKDFFIYYFLIFWDFFLPVFLFVFPVLNLIFFMNYYD